MVSGLGDGDFGEDHKGMSIVCCLQMEAEKSLSVLGLLTEFSYSRRQEEKEVVPLLV